MGRSPRFARSREERVTIHVIASEAKQSTNRVCGPMDCFVAIAPRNDAGWNWWLRRRDRRFLDQTVAGLSCTDSPQPQAPIWFGLLNTNWACILSAL